MRIDLASLWLLAVLPLAASGGEPPAPSANEALQRQGPGQAASAPTRGQSLFAQHCGACHGPNGDGKGPSAVFVFPRPRNFRDGKFKLVSTDNSVPSEADLEAVLVRGMPGSSMPSWAHLSPGDRAALIGEIYRLTSEGAREKYIDNLRQQQLTDDEIKAPDVQDEIAAYARQRTTPGAPLAVPAIPPPDAAAIARGRELFLQQSCHSCHGEQGKGDGVKEQWDDDGMPTRPRDLTRGIFKGGDDPASLFVRISRGMPGTPMPSAPLLTESQVIDLAHYLRSLSTEAQRQAVVLKRRQLTARRVSKLPQGPDDEAWAGVEATPIQTFPLWWRDDAEPGLMVQAAHDGQTVAVRLVWNDATRDTSAFLPQEFEDMAALELFGGPADAEPFWGMGAVGKSIDLWHWRGGRGYPAEQLSQLDEYPLDTPLYRALAEGKAWPDFLTARAAGNPLAVSQVERRPHGSAANLAAAGVGSTTFRMPPHQLVTAEAAYHEGRWSVVLSRRLAVPPEGGLLLSPGQPYSIAFALWDGAHRERGPQKQVSIWNDFRLQ